MTHSVCADAAPKRRVTGNMAKRYLLDAPKERDLTVGYSYIYVIQSGDRGPVKIGHGKSPLWRMCQLQIGSWEELHLRAALAVLDGCHKSLEAQVHQMAKGKHIRGEWFSLEPLDAVACVLKAAHDLDCLVGTAVARQSPPKAPQGRAQGNRHRPRRVRPTVKAEPERTEHGQ